MPPLKLQRTQEGAEAASFLSPRPRPFWFESGGNQLFAWYHPAHGARRDAAILLCDPFGSDRMNLHLTYRELASSLARAGFAVLRFDYPGTCDSSGVASTHYRIESWIASLHDASDLLRRLSGCRKLGVFGVLLGATLGLELARLRPDVEALVVWAPYLDGNQFLRETTAMRALGEKGNPVLPPSYWREGDREAVGFLLPREMVRELEALSPGRGPIPTLRELRILVRDDGKRETELREALESENTAIFLDAEPHADLSEVLSHRAPLPSVLIRRVVVGFEVAFAPPPADHERTSEPPTLSTRNTFGALPPAEVSLRFAGTLVRERFVGFGDDQSIVGILTEPASPALRRGTAVLLVNGGNNHRVGINRSYVDWARHWATLGLVTLRMDIRGLGDSPPAADADLNVLYRPETVLDVRAAIDFLARGQRPRRIVVGGLCAGGYQSLHTALVDSRVSGLVLLNPLRFESTRDAVPLRKLRFRQVRELPGLVGRKLVRQLGRYLPVNQAPAHPISKMMERLARRGVRTLIVFDAEEPMLTLFNQAIEPGRARLLESGRLKIELVPHADHIFSPLESQETLSRILTAYVLEQESRT